MDLERLIATDTLQGVLAMVHRVGQVGLAPAAVTVTAAAAAGVGAGGGAGAGGATAAGGEGGSSRSSGGSGGGSEEMFTVNCEYAPHSQVM